MTDIMRKLELLANLKPGDMLPAELGVPEFGWGGAISEICAEALAEIQFCRSELVRHSIRLHGCRFDKIGDNWRDAVRAVTVDCGDGVAKVNWDQVFNTELAKTELPNGEDPEWQRVRAEGMKMLGLPVKEEPYYERLGNDIVRRVNSAVDTAIGKIDPDQLKPATPDSPAPDPWGSPFAMNTENWR